MGFEKASDENRAAEAPENKEEITSLRFDVPPGMSEEQLAQALTKELFEVYPKHFGYDEEEISDFPRETGISKTERKWDLDRDNSFWLFVSGNVASFKCRFDSQNPILHQVLKRLGIQANS